MFKQWQIVKVINPNYSTYGMIGRVERNYKTKKHISIIKQYGTERIITTDCKETYDKNDDIYVSFNTMIGNTNSGIFKQEDLEIILE